MDIEARFYQALEQFQVPGASLAIYEAGKPRAVLHHGVCRVSDEDRVSENTLFHIGSITKLFTATLVMQAVDEGLLQLDDPVQKYLADFRLADEQASRRITIAMLLNHTSSIDMDMFAQPERDGDRVIDGYHAVLGANSLFPPGEGQGYSNGATVVAGHLIEKIRQRGWYELVNERIYQPLDMHRAIAHPVEAFSYSVSCGHEINANGELEVAGNPLLPLSMAPAGSTLCMSANDLCKFGAMHARDGMGLNGQRVLSEASAKLMRKQSTAMEVGGILSAFGLGWGIGYNGIVRHSGAGVGTTAQIMLHQPSETVFAMLSNSVSGMNAIGDVAKAYFEDRQGIDPGAHYLPNAEQPGLSIDPEPVVGRYYSNVVWWQIECDQGDFSISGGPCLEGVPNFSDIAFEAVPLVPIDSTSFMAKPGDISKLGPFGMFLTMPVGVTALSDGKYQRFLAGTRSYARRGH